LGAVQSQDYAGAKWGLGQRLRAATDATLEREIDDGAILRTHVLRPTWHVVAPEAIRWMLALTAPRVSAMMASMNRRLELDRNVFRRANAVFERALRDGGFLTRTELRAHLERSGIAIATGQRLGHLVMQGELDGVLCSGPRRGKQFTYALLEMRVPAAPTPTREEALLELTRRYFSTRGPATVRDYAWWSGLTVAEARRGIEHMGTDLERVTIDDQPYWRPAGRRTPRAVPSAHLLPNYDEYFIGFRDRRAIAARIGNPSPVMGASALVPHVIIVDGELVGTWKRELVKDKVIVTLRYQTRLASQESSRIARAVESLGRFLGVPPDVREQRMTGMQSMKS
jgi:hypothetical protein